MYGDEFSGSGRGAALWFAAYFGTLMAALVLAAILILILLVVNRSRGIKYKTPRRDFVMASVVMLFFVLAGSAQGGRATTQHGFKRTVEPGPQRAAKLDGLRQEFTRISPEAFK